jgi:pro-apoptotic serine protease NMA111
MTTRFAPATIRGICTTSSTITRNYFAPSSLLAASLSTSSRYQRLSSSKLSIVSHSKPLPTSPQVSRSSPSTRLSRPFSSSQLNMSTNGYVRPKRRTRPVRGLETPAKQLKPEIIAPTPGDTTPLNGTVYSVDDEPNSTPIIAPLAAAADSPEWQATIENVVKSVVSIHFCQTCSFDTDLSMSSQATGFVVDAERGYIMTNRHVVCAGPFWGYCLFDNHEEVCINSF